MIKYICKTLITDKYLKKAAHARQETDPKWGEAELGEPQTRQPSGDGLATACAVLIATSTVRGYGID